MPHKSLNVEIKQNRDNYKAITPNADKRAKTKWPVNREENSCANKSKDDVKKHHHSHEEIIGTTSKAAVKKHHHKIVSKSASKLESLSEYAEGDRASESSEEIDDDIIHSLKREQRDPFKQSLKIYHKSHVCANVGDRGTGKTDLTALQSRHLDIPMFVICPSTLIHKWKRRATAQGAKILVIMSYQTLAGRKGKCNHEYLKIVNGKYSLTKKMRELYKSGVMIVTDEYQMAKNKDTRNRKALCALTAEIVQFPKSKIAMVSASPFERKEIADVVPRVAGIVTCDDSLEYDNNTLSYNQTGIKQLIKFCKKLDADLLKSALPTEITNNNVEEVYYDLITKVLIPKISISIPKHKSNNVHIIQNRFYSLNEDQSRRMREAIDKYHRKIAACMGTGRKAGIGAANNQYENEAELIYIECIAEDVLRLISQDKNSKYAILVTQHAAVEILQQLLKKYEKKIAVITGKVKDTEERDNICNRFCDDNDDIKILIGNLSICAKGLDLDDKFGTKGIDGERRRFVFIPSNSKFHDVYHSTSRSDRRTTKSDSLTTITYADVPEDHKRMIKQNGKVGTLGDSVRTHYEINFPLTATYDKNNKIDANDIFVKYKEMLRVPTGPAEG